MILNNLSGPAVFASIVLGLAVLLVPDGPFRITAAVLAVAGIIAWSYIEPRVRASQARARAHRRRYGL